MASLDFLFSNKNYRDKIKIEACLISEERISNIFSKDNTIRGAALAPENYKELYGKKVYLAVRLKNEGRLGAWGTLLCTIDRSTTKIYVNRVPFQEWDIYLIPIGILTWDRSDGIPKVSIEWGKLYVK